MATAKTLILILLYSVLLGFLNSPIEASNILVFIGSGTYSHKLSIWPLVTALADKGHNVTVLTSLEKQPVVHPLVNHLYSVALQNMANTVYDVDRVQDRLDGNHMKIIDTYNEDIVKTCENILTVKGDPELDYVLHQGQFDLVINNMILGECGHIVAHQKRAKLVLFASTPFIPWFHDEFGFPDEAAIIPDISQTLYYPMGMWSRFKNYLAIPYWFLRRRLWVYPRLEEIMQKGYDLRKEDVPAFKDIYQNTDLVLLATHFSTGYAMSLPPFMVSIGGMQCFLPKEPLSADYKKILDDAKDGAVLIAFGSSINLATMPREIKSAFFQMMKEFPKVKFIWRWDGPEPENKPGNLIISKWLPQFQILGHPNLKAFISHAGLNSITEATFHGVPVILTPLFADQDYNAYRIEAQEIGLRVEMREVTPKLLTWSVDQVLNNPKYSKNMMSLSKLFKDRPVNPIDAAVYWTEFVLKHDDLSSLKPLRSVNFFQRRLWDVFLILFIVSFILMVMIFKIICKLWKTIFTAERFSKNITNPHKPMKFRNGVGQNLKTKKKN